MSLGELILLVLGVGIGLWLVAEPLREGGGNDPAAVVLLVAGGVLGGASLVGVPLLVRERLRRPGRPFGAGRTLWFAHGTAAWLLWPPIVADRLRTATPGTTPTIEPDVPQICYFYGTPLMGLYVATALIVGGRWPRPWRRRRGRAPLPWRERFGLLLGLAWACLGVYVLSLIYRGRLR